jgi:hypothetical protein
MQSTEAEPGAGAAPPLDFETQPPRPWGRAFQSLGGKQMAFLPIFHRWRKGCLLNGLMMKRRRAGRPAFTVYWPGSGKETR